MEGVLQFIFEVIQFIINYILPPAILIAIQVYATFMTFRLSGRPIEAWPRIAGYIVGYLLLIVTIILKINGYLELDRSASSLELWEIAAFGAFGFLLGFFFLLMIRYLVRSRVAPFLIMALVGGASVSLFFFTFLDEARDILVIGVVAFLIGIGVYGMLFPEAIRKALGR